MTNLKKARYADAETERGCGSCFLCAEENGCCPAASAAAGIIADAYVRSLEEGRLPDGAAVRMAEILYSMEAAGKGELAAAALEGFMCCAGEAECADLIGYLGEISLRQGNALRDFMAEFLADERIDDLIMGSYIDDLAGERPRAARRI